MIQSVVFGVEDLLKSDDLCFVLIDTVNVMFDLYCEIRETLHSKTVFALKQAFSHSPINIKEIFRNNFSKIRNN